jgi:hypothetical protein
LPEKQLAALGTLLLKLLMICMVDCASTSSADTSAKAASNETARERLQFENENLLISLLTAAPLCFQFIDTDLTMIIIVKINPYFKK